MDTPSSVASLCQVVKQREGKEYGLQNNINMYLSKVSCSKFFQQFELISRKVHGNLRVLVCNIKQNKRVVVVSHGFVNIKQNKLSLLFPMGSVNTIDQH